MKQKFTYLLFLLTFITLVGIGSNAHAQSVSGTATTTGCSGGGTITASSTGILTPQYQLLQGSIVVLPDASNPTIYTNVPIFSGLVSGSYTLRARQNAVSTVYTSAIITVANGYTAMTVSSPSITVPCATASAAIKATVTGGKANYTYSIAKQTAPGVPLQLPLPNTSATTFTFDPLPVGDYIISVTDNCGATVTSAASITQSGVLITGIMPAGLVVGRTTAGGNCASTKIVLRSFYGLGYDNTGGQNATASDKANFTWRLEYNGLSYGQDINADGNPDLLGPDFNPTTQATTVMPDGTTDWATAMAGNPKYVLYDKCGNSRSFTPTTLNTILFNAVLCSSNGKISLADSYLGGSAACYPITWTFTPASGSSPVITFVQTTPTVTIPDNFVAGLKYNISYIDSASPGRTTGLYNSTSVTFPTVANPYGLPNGRANPNIFNSFNTTFSSAINSPGDIITTKVISSPGGMFDGYTSTYTSTVSVALNFAPTYPPGYGAWPAGPYVFEISGPCGVSTINYNGPGYSGVLSSLTTTPVCGGFTVVPNVTGITTASEYEIIIVSGPTNVGQVKSLVNTTTGVPFTLGYGTYVFGIRPKVASTGNHFNTVSVTLSNTNAIVVDKANTGGFVCSAGATNGELTITASSASGSALTYAISLDGGGTYSAYQTGNKFTGLTNGTYFFRVKDACGNEVTNSAQIGVAASPVPSANGQSGTATFCAGTVGSTVTLALDVNVASATYLWAGPAGVFSNTPTDPNYKGLKNPVLAITSLPIGTNAITCTVTLGAPCNSTSTGNLNIIIQPLPTATIAYPTGLCATGTASVTRTGEAGGTYSASPAGLDINATTGAINLSNSIANTYTVSYTFGYVGGVPNACTNTATTSVIVNALPATPSLTITQADCTTPTATITVNPIVAGLTYSKDGVDYSNTTGVFSGLVAGSAYSITAKNANGCISTAATGTLAAGGLAPVLTITNPAAVCAASTVDITLPAVTAGSTGGGTLSYWTNADGTGAITDPTQISVSNTYYIKVTNGTCSDIKPVVVTINSAPTLTSAGSVSQAVCAGTAISNIRYTFGGSATNVTITGLPSGLSANIAAGVLTISGVPSATGTYSVETTGQAASCSPVVLGGTITVNPTPATPTVTTATPTTFCTGGSVVLTSSSATGNTWYKDGVVIAGATGQTYTANATGNYTVVVTTTGCPSAPSGGTMVTVNPTPATPTVTTSTATTFCTGGSVVLSSSSATGNQWYKDGVVIAGATGQTYTANATGNYTVVVTTTGCPSAPSGGTTVTVNLTPATPTVTASTATTFCTGGSVVLNSSSAAGNQWYKDGAMIAGATGQTYTANTTGNYTVVVTTTGCPSAPSVGTTVTVNPIPSSPLVSISAQPVCGTPTGSISITGVAGETYSVDGGTYSTTLIYSGLMPGLHNILSKSSSGCISTIPTTITINPAKTAAVKPVVAISAQPVCGMPTGSIAITGVAGETYSVDGSAYSATLTYSGLTPGSHSILAKSVDGCISAATNIIINPAKTEAVKPVVAVSAQPVCGMQTGSIAITGVAGETYSVDGSAYSATLTYAGLGPGNHTILAKSVDGCISAPTTTTINPAKTEAVKPVVAISAQPVCGMPTGSIAITGVAGETYSVDGSAYSATLTYSGLTPGSHTVLAKSIDGCISAPTTITINPAKTEAVKPVVVISAQPVCGTPTGSITITSVGGETYSVDGSAYSATLTYSGLTPGSHSILAKSVDGCISAPTTITINPAKTEAVKPVVAVSAQPTCAVATGTITINAIAGETYSVDGGAYSNITTYNLAAGLHTISAKSTDGCISATSSITINAQPATPSANISYSASTYQAVGSTAVNQTGQTGGTYSVSPAGLSINLTTGQIDLSTSTPNQDYLVTYTFSNGSCTSTTNTTVRVNSRPAIIGYPNAAYCATGTASITQSGPTGGVYTASPTGLKINAANGTVNLSASSAGTYTVTYTYQDGSITASTTCTITVNAMPILTLTSDLKTGNSVSLGDVVTLTATGGLTYSWTGEEIQGGQGTNVISVRPKQTTTYTVMATNATGCSDVMQITINIVNDRKLIPNNVITPNGDGKNDTWIVKNLDYYPNHTVTIYDRAGRKLYSTKGYKNDWDGTYNGLPLAEGAYIYVIDSGAGIGLLRGTVSIIRDQR